MKWEYQVQNFSIREGPDGLEDGIADPNQTLLEMGDEGWEIFCIIQDPIHQKTGHEFLAFAKRPTGLHPGKQLQD